MLCFGEPSHESVAHTPAGPCHVLQALGPLALLSPAVGQEPTDTQQPCPGSQTKPPEMPDPQKPGTKPLEPGIKTGITRLRDALGCCHLSDTPRAILFYFFLFSGASRGISQQQRNTRLLRAAFWKKYMETFSYFPKQKMLRGLVTKGKFLHWFCKG